MPLESALKHILKKDLFVKSAICLKRIIIRRKRGILLYSKKSSGITSSITNSKKSRKCKDSVRRNVDENSLGSCRAFSDTKVEFTIDL